MTNLHVNEYVYLVIARLSHTLSKVAVHQRLVDKDGFVYCLQNKWQKWRYKKIKELGQEVPSLTREVIYLWSSYMYANILGSVIKASC